MAQSKGPAHSTSLELPAHLNRPLRTSLDTQRTSPKAQSKANSTSLEAQHTSLPHSSHRIRSSTMNHEQVSTWVLLIDMGQHKSPKAQSTAKSTAHSTPIEAQHTVAHRTSLEVKHTTPDPHSAQLNRPLRTYLDTAFPSLEGSTRLPYANDHSAHLKRRFCAEATHPE